MASQTDIRQKEIINITDGRRMGAVVDMEFTQDGHIRTLTVPGPFRIKDLFKGEKGGIVIPWEKVRSIGVDVIRVELDPQALRSARG